jgi:ubiquinol-cytochrome c reductase cytochrome c1 subunit
MRLAAMSAPIRSLVLAGAFAFSLAGAASAVEQADFDAQDWSFYGIFGTYDRAAVQRGYQVYAESCSICHGLRLLSYRNLGDIGFSAAEVKAIAAQFEVTDGPDDEGDMFERPARPADRFVSPFANDNAARSANNGALPPDLSLIVKARARGPDYVYALLNGYAEAPDDHPVTEGMSYNPVFPGAEIAMPPPLFDDAVEYADGTPATVDQMAEDVVSFLHWAAEPKLEERKRMGLKVMLFLIILSGLFIAVKQKVWRDLH